MYVYYTEYRSNTCSLLYMFRSSVFAWKCCVCARKQSHDVKRIHSNSCEMIFSSSSNDIFSFFLLSAPFSSYFPWKYIYLFICLCMCSSLLYSFSLSLSSSLTLSLNLPIILALSELVVEIIDSLWTLIFSYSDFEMSVSEWILIQKRTLIETKCSHENSNNWDFDNDRTLVL